MIYEQTLRQGGDQMLRESSAYFAGQGRLHSTLHRLVGGLDAAGIPYALLGGLGVVLDCFVRQLRQLPPKLLAATLAPPCPLLKMPGRLPIILQQQSCPNSALRAR